MISYQLLGPKQLLEEDVSDINFLLHQLTSSSPIWLDFERIKDIAKNSHFAVARDEKKRIIGMSTLTISHIPTGIVGHLDDVVVAISSRRRGVGEGLIEFLICEAKMKYSIDRINLTCKPSRVKANKLYQKLGFRKRETNCYVLKF